MKRPQNNLGTLIKQEIVSRFESVVKNEINDFNQTKSNTDSRICQLESELQSLKKQLEEISNQSKTRDQNILDKFIEEKKSLEDSFEEQRRYMKTNVLETKKFISDQENLSSKYILTSDFNKILTSINSHICSILQDQNKIKEETACFIEKRSKESLEYSDQKNKDLKEQFDKVCLCLDGYKNNLEEYKVNNDGVLKELLVYKKTVFLLQKHIEDIYVQIERLKR